LALVIGLLLRPASVSDVLWRAFWLLTIQTWRGIELREDTMRGAVGAITKRADVADDRANGRENVWSKVVVY